MLAIAGHSSTVMRQPRAVSSGAGDFLCRTVAPCLLTPINDLAVTRRRAVQTPAHGHELLATEGARPHFRLAHPTDLASLFRWQNKQLTYRALCHMSVL